MNHALRYPAVEQAKNELTEFKRINFAPTAFFEYGDNNFLIPKATATEDEAAIA
jgi:hypothetical protein